MSYATLAEFKQFVGTRSSPPGLYEQMTDRVAAAAADDGVGQMLLDGAAGAINARLAARYAVPIAVGSDATLAAFLRRAVCIVAAFDGWSQHPKLSELRRTVEKSYDELMELLADIAAGKADLPAEAAPAGSTRPGAGTAIGSPAVFTPETMRGL